MNVIVHRIVFACSLVVAAGVGGCTIQADAPSTPDTSTAETKAAPSCAARKGVYEWTSTCMDGDCSGDPQVLTFDADDCTQNFCRPLSNRIVAGTNVQADDGRVALSADNCVMEYSVTEPFGEGEGETRKMVGSFTWAKDGQGGEGTEHTTIFDAEGNAVFSARYNRSVVKL